MHIKYIFYEERKVDEAVNGNAHLRRPSKENDFRNKFRKQYKGDFTNTAKKVLRIKMLKQLIRLYIKK